MNETNPKYVSLMPDYTSARVSYGTFNGLAVVMGIVIFLVLIIIIGLGSVKVKNAPFTRLDLSNIIPNVTGNSDQTLHSDHGQSTDKIGGFKHISDGSGVQDATVCNGNATRQFLNGSCQCRKPFWGPYCAQESYSDDYIPIGSYDLKDLHFLSDSFKVHRNSFPMVDNELADVDQSTCRNECNKNYDCMGYYYVNDSDLSGLKSDDWKHSNISNTCGLLKNVPIFQGEHYPIGSDSNIFLRKTKTVYPKLMDEVILYSGNLPARFWLEKRTSNKGAHVLNIGINVLNHINFYPENLVNDSNSTIIFSRKSFLRVEADEIIKNFINTSSQSLGWHVCIKGKSELYPPHNWTTTGDNFWVMAVNPKRSATFMEPGSPAAATLSDELSHVDTIESANFYPEPIDEMRTPISETYSGRLVSSNLKTIMGKTIPAGIPYDCDPFSPPTKESADEFLFSSPVEELGDKSLSFSSSIEESGDKSSQCNSLSPSVPTEESEDISLNEDAINILNKAGYHGLMSEWSDF